MTAGGGILHQEMPKASPRMLGLQLWINLPRDKKMVHPKYRDITPDDIPVIEEKGVTIRVVTGKYGNIGGATQGEYVDVQFLDVEMGRCVGNGDHPRQYRVLVSHGRFVRL